MFVKLLLVFILAAHIVRAVTIGDLLSVSHIANFHTQPTMLRLPHSNAITLNGTKYELRVFAFYMNQVCSVFGMFARATNITEVELQPSQESVFIHPLYYYESTPELYLVISLMAYQNSSGCSSYWPKEAAPQYRHALVKI